MKTYVFITFDNKVYSVTEKDQRLALMKLESHLGKYIDIKDTYLVTESI